ncbi:hypothetical protein [Wenjunlia tyrosinilytica]|nr:hypothetical protein [Wenjunlia tyrosinilytica]
MEASVAVLAEPLKLALDACGAEGSSTTGFSEPPLTAEPFLAEDTPLTSEPPMAAEPALTSEPAVVGVTADPLEI